MNASLPSVGAFLAFCWGCAVHTDATAKNSPADKSQLHRTALNIVTLRKRNIDMLYASDRVLL